MTIRNNVLTCARYNLNDKNKFESSKHLKGQIFPMNMLQWSIYWRPYRRFGWGICVLRRVAEPNCDVVGSIYRKEMSQSDALVTICNDSNLLVFILIFFLWFPFSLSLFLPQLEVNLLVFYRWSKGDLNRSQEDQSCIEWATETYSR